MSDTPAALTPQGWTDDEFPWINAELNSNTQLGTAARTISHWGKDWHREGKDEAACNSAFNDVLDLADTITKQLATIATQVTELAEKQKYILELERMITWKWRRRQSEERQTTMPYLSERGYQDTRAECEQLRTKVAQLEQEQTALWHSLNTMSEYVETLEQQLAEATAWEPVPNGTYTHTLADGRSWTLLVIFDGAELEQWSNQDVYKDGSPKDVEEISLGEFRLCHRATLASADEETTDD